MLDFIFCFGFGILSDALVSIYLIAVGRGRAWVAALISIPIALLNFLVIDLVLLKTSLWWGALAYAAGNAIGCFFIVKLSRKIQ